MKEFPPFEVFALSVHAWWPAPEAGRRELDPRIGRPLPVRHGQVAQNIWRRAESPCVSG